MKIRVTLEFDDVNPGADIKTIVEVVGDASYAISQRILSQRVANRISRHKGRRGRGRIVTPEQVAGIMEGHRQGMSLREIKEHYALPYSPMTIRGVIQRGAQLGDLENLAGAVVPEFDAGDAMTFQSEHVSQMPQEAGEPIYCPHRVPEGEHCEICDDPEIVATSPADPDDEPFIP